MLNKQVTVSTTPVRVDSGIVNQDIAITPRGDVYLSDRSVFATTDTTFVRMVSSGSVWAVNGMSKDSVDRGVYLRTASGSVVVDITEDGVNHV